MMSLNLQNIKFFSNAFLNNLNIRIKELLDINNILVSLLILLNVRFVIYKKLTAVII